MAKERVFTKAADRLRKLADRIEAIKPTGVELARWKVWDGVIDAERGLDDVMEQRVLHKRRMGSI